MSDCTPTLADLCSAIAEGHVSTSIDGDMYQVNLRELRRYFRMLRSLSTATLPAIHNPASQPVSNCPSTASVSL